MQIIFNLCCLCMFLVGCTKDNSLSTCEFKYYNHKEVKSPIYLLKNSLDTYSDYLNYHEIVDGNGNIAKCIKKHVDPKLIDKAWYEIITIYYPEIHETLKFGDNENNLLVYSAFGGITNKKNYCYGYAKKGEVQLVSNKINFINVEIDFIGKENKKEFCKKEFGNTLTHNAKPI